MLKKRGRAGRGRVCAAPFAAALLLAGGTARAAFTSAPIGELASRADAAFEGRVERVECFWEETAPRLYTVATVRVWQPFKGELPARVHVRTSGGRKDGLVMASPDFPRFEPGMELVLFCRRSVRDGELRVLAQRAGEFVREGDRFTRDVAGGESYAEADFIEFVERACAGEEVEPPRALPASPQRLQKAGPRRISVERPVQKNLEGLRSGAEKDAPEKSSTGEGAFLGVLAFLVAAAALAALRRKKAAVVLLALSLGMRAEGYTRINWYGSYVWWDISGGEVGWRMRSDATPDTLLEFDAVSTGFQVWEDIPTSEIGFEHLGNPTSEIDQLDGENVVFFDTVDPWGDFDAFTLALTVFWADDFTGEMLDADIKFNSVAAYGLTFSSFGEGGTQPIEGLIDHEAGHVVGLDHTNVRTATLYYLYSPSVATLDQDDIDGATAIYPDSTPPPAPVITTNGGADFGQAPQELVIQGTMSDETWTITVNGSTEGVAAFTPGDTAWSYSDWLGSSGAHVFNVVAADATGNQSAPATITVTLNSPAPVITYFSLSDVTTSSMELTNSALVGVGVGLEGDAAAWLVREESADPTPAEVADSLPASFVLSSGEGEHTVYLWAKDASDNISTRAEARIVLDSIEPRVLPNAEVMDSNVVVVRFSEAVVGADVASAYSVPGATVAAVTPLDADRAMLTLSGLTASQSYTVTVSGVTDLTGENAVSPPSDQASFVAVADDEAQVSLIRLTSRWTTNVTFSEEVLGATDVMNYRVAWPDFDWLEDAPAEVNWLGGDTYELWHTDLYVPPFPYITWLLARDITDPAGRHIYYNTPGWYDGNLDVDFPIVGDSTLPSVDSFELYSLVDGDISQTRMRLVGVRMTESDADGAVIRWLVKEDAIPPDAAEMLQEGVPRRPVLFELSAGAGAHTVYAWVMDDSQNVSPAASDAIALLVNSAPSAVADGSPLTGLEPLDVSFTAAGSSDPEGDPLSYAWVFGDGELAWESSLWHTYTQPGTYDVKLVVSDGFGAFGEDTLTVVVGSDVTPPELDVPMLVLKGRVDSALVTGVDVSGTWHDLTLGAFEATVPVADGANQYTITADDGLGPPTVLNVSVEKQR